MTADDKIAAFETLLAEVSGALADLVQCAQDGQASASEISTTLVDLLGVLETRQAPVTQEPSAMPALIEAIQALRQTPPQVVVNPVIEVLPTPISNIVNVPAPMLQIHERAACDFVLTPSYGRSGQITEMVIRRIPVLAA